MRVLEFCEVNEVSGGLAHGILDALVGGVTSTLVGAADGLYSGAKRFSSYAEGSIHNTDPLSGIVNGLGAILGTGVGAVGGALAGAVGGLGSGLVNGTAQTGQLTDMLNHYIDQALGS